MFTHLICFRCTSGAVGFWLPIEANQAGVASETIASFSVSCVGMIFSRKIDMRTGLSDQWSMPRFCRCTTVEQLSKFTKRLFQLIQKVINSPINRDLWFVVFMHCCVVLHLAGALLDAMADGIERSSVVLVCFSREYKMSHNCETGFYIKNTENTLLLTYIHRES